MWKRKSFQSVKQSNQSSAHYGDGDSEIVGYQSVGDAHAITLVTLFSILVLLEI